MTVRRFIGRCAIATSLGCALFASSVYAQPAESFAEQTEAILDQAAQSWVEQILIEPAPLDEQIFTEISPLIDSPEAIKLPADQEPQE